MFSRLLIANRGEIACRVITTARRMGLRTVAVYSEADRDARHVRMADEAVHIGPAAAAQSYLDSERILAAAKATHAQAIHPGYGFLSENAAFATACDRAGLVFVGPSADAIAAMGDKSAAKALMAKAGVPLVPGYHGEHQQPAFLQSQADAIGYPVLIKASAGGGGKGMRIVQQAAEFAAALASCQREAQSAFGDARVLVERYLVRPRHIEIQVFGDTHGNVLHLFERDCSVQRRHQKVLEEAPAPGMSAARRREMGEAAVAAAKAIGYTGAGTIEFIAETDPAHPGALGQRFYFMEMNTRLQVEHPVTEMITGLDLVEWQLRVAAGEALPLTQAAIAMQGHAIEARIYAEDPQRDFLPQTGRITHLAFPSGEGVRVDTGVSAGAQISPWYDPMIAKLIVHGRDREQALARMAEALATTRIAGLACNTDFLGRIIAGHDFANALLDTSLIERNRDELLPSTAEVPDAVLALAAWAELEALRGANGTHAQIQAGTDPHSPWGLPDGWRMNLASHHVWTWTCAEAACAATLHFALPLQLELGSGKQAFSGERTESGELQVRLGEQQLRGHVVASEHGWTVFHGGRSWRLERPAAFHDAEGEAPGGSLAAPMPGRIVAVLVNVGEHVDKGTPLVILEAMKMEHTIVAPRAGVVAAIQHGAGEQVTEGSELVVLNVDAPAQMEKPRP